MDIADVIDHMRARPCQENIRKYKEELKYLRNSGPNAN